MPSKILYECAGPHNKKYPLLVYFIFVFSLLSLFVILIERSIFWMVIDILTLGTLSFVIWVVVFVISNKMGLYNRDAHIFKIYDNKIVSKELHNIKIVQSQNIRKMKYERDIGRTGSRILIWPNDYEVLREYGFNLNPRYTTEWRKEHNIAVILYPPAMSRAERKRLKEAIEEFKRINGIE